jgi:hypothetical protein
MHHSGTQINVKMSKNFCLRVNIYVMKSNRRVQILVQVKFVIRTQTFDLGVCVSAAYLVKKCYITRRFLCTAHLVCSSVVNYLASWYSSLPCDTQIYINSQWDSRVDLWSLFPRLKRLHGEGEGVFYVVLRHGHQFYAFHGHPIADRREFEVLLACSWCLHCIGCTCKSDVRKNRLHM